MNKFEIKTNSFKTHFTPNSAKLTFDKFSNRYLFSKEEINLEIPTEIYSIIQENKNHPYLNYALTIRLFNLCLGMSGLPIFNIRKSGIYNDFDVLDRLYDQPDNINYLGLKIKNKNNIICIKEHHNPISIQSGDKIIGFNSTGFHFTNYSYLLSKLKNISNWRSKPVNNMTTIFDSLCFPTCTVDHLYLLQLLWSNNIKRIITPKRGLVADLEDHIPNGLRALVATHMLIKSPFVSNVCSMAGITGREIYENLSPDLGLMLIVDKLKFKLLERDLHFRTPYIKILEIGQITEGNLGQKVHLHF